MSGETGVHLVLASASPARLLTLQRAGVQPTVEVSGADESTVSEADPAVHALRLAELKAHIVTERLRADGTTHRASRHRTFVLGCDSVLELQGVAYGKPGSPAEAELRWRRMRGQQGILHTGHCLVDLHGRRLRSETASTRVRFGNPTDDEISAYVATGEPLEVAGAFTIDGLGGAFIEGVEGDPHNVVGLSLPLLRRLLAELDVAWPALWAPGAPR
ncbi:MAG: Maf family protein [Nocardioidaceae bacterium]